MIVPSVNAMNVPEKTQQVQGRYRRLVDGIEKQRAADQQQQPANAKAEAEDTQLLQQDQAERGQPADDGQMQPVQRQIVPGSPQVVPSVQTPVDELADGADEEQTEEADCRSDQRQPAHFLRRQEFGQQSIGDHQQDELRRSTEDNEYQSRPRTSVQWFLASRPAAKPPDRRPALPRSPGLLPTARPLWKRCS